MATDRSDVPATLATGVGIATAAVGLLGAVVALGWPSPAGGGEGLGAGLAAAVGLVALVTAVVVAVLGVGLAALGTVSRRRGWVRPPAGAVGGYLALVATIVGLVTSSVRFEPATTVFALGVVFGPPVGFAGGWLVAGRSLSSGPEN